MTLIIEYHKILIHNRCCHLPSLQGNKHNRRCKTSLSFMMLFFFLVVFLQLPLIQHILFPITAKILAQKRIAHSRVTIWWLCGSHAYGSLQHNFRYVRLYSLGLNHVVQHTLMCELNTHPSCIKCQQSYCTSRIPYYITKYAKRNYLMSHATLAAKLMSYAQTKLYTCRVEKTIKLSTWFLATHSKSRTQNFWGSARIEDASNALSVEPCINKTK